jgi:DNA-binding HxlR family transcriptional regulator
MLLGREAVNNVFPRKSFLRWDGKGKKVLKLLARSGVCEVLFKLETEPRKFSQLMFDVKINPGALSRNLKNLVELGVVSKKDQEMYELTEYGRELVSSSDSSLGLEIIQS